MLVLVDVAMFTFCFCSGEEDTAEPAANVFAPTSTSNTLVLSEARRAVEERSSSHPQDVEASTPPASPRASSPKRPRLDIGDSLLAGGSATPPLEDVSVGLRLLLPYFCFVDDPCLTLLLSLP
jgi:hypothetical protein